MYKLIIEGRLPGLNDYTEACRRNPHVGAKMKKDAQKLCKAYIWQQLRGVHLTHPIRAHFLWVEKNRRRDFDNIAFGKKFIFDALVECGVIQTDGWKGVEGFTDDFDCDPIYPRIEVLIEEVIEDGSL